MYKIFYSNGKEYTNTDGSDPPRRDVQVILQEGASGPYFQSSSDYYLWLGDRWLGADIFGLCDFLKDTGLVKFGIGTIHEVLHKDKWVSVDIMGLFEYLLATGLVLFGRTITNEDYQKVYQKAKVQKHTWRPRERRP